MMKLTVMLKHDVTKETVEEIITQAKEIKLEDGWFGWVDVDFPDEWLEFPIRQIEFKIELLDKAE